MTFHPENDDVQSFERRSSTYEDSYFQNLFFDWIHRDALDSITAGFNPGSILDIGCGTGRLLRKAATRWPSAQLSGVDPSQGMVKEAQRLTPNVQFYVGPAESLPLLDRSVDLVFSTMSFHHWQDQLQGVREAKRVLKTGGVFVLVDVFVPWGLRQLFQHGRPVNPTSIAEMFAKAGFDVQRQQRVMAHFILITNGKRAKD
jgi:ubiquinone/menaquinone biosynthesis C-methylase UbiE